MEAVSGAMTTAVGEWNQRCVTTAKEYFGAAGLLGSPYPPPTTPAASEWFWRDSLLSEVSTKITWLHSMQMMLKG